MKYRLRKGVVMFKLCGSYYLFPSRNAGLPLAFLVSISEEILPFLSVTADTPTNPVSFEVRKKLQNLIRLKYVEEC